MYACMHSCMHYVCMHACMYVCMCVIFNLDFCAVPEQWRAWNVTSCRCSSNHGLYFHHILMLSMPLTSPSPPPGLGLALFDGTISTVNGGLLTFIKFR